MMSYYKQAACLLCLCVAVGCATTKPSPNPILIRPMFQKGAVSLKAKPSNDEAGAFESLGEKAPGEKTYLPNNHGAFGIGLGFKGFSVSYAKPFQPEDDDSEGKGTTDGSDTQLHFSIGSFGIDLAHQQFKGFYEESDAAPNTYFIHKDMEIRRSAVNLFWVSDMDSFQYDAAFGQSTFSEKSGWSFIAMLAADQSTLKSLPATLTTDLTQDGVNALDEVRYQTVGVLGGLGLRGITTGMGWFNGIFGSIAVLVGPALQDVQTTFADGTTKTAKQAHVLKTNSRFSIGIDKGLWFIGGGFWADTSSVKGEKVDLELASSQIESYLGMRF